MMETKTEKKKKNKMFKKEWNRHADDKIILKNLEMEWV